jgi:hypothetical protein
MVAECKQLAGEPSARQRGETARSLAQQLQELAAAMDADRLQRDSQRTARQNERQQQQAARREADLQAARNFVQKTLAEERGFEQLARISAAKPNQQLAEQQKSLQQSLDQFIRENPSAFSNCMKQCQGASSAMQQAENAMRKGGSGSQQQVQKAAEMIGELDNALQQQQRQNAIARGHELKQMLDQQIQQLDQLQGDPSAASASQCQSAGAQSKSITDQIQKLPEQLGAGDGPGRQIEQALDDQAKQQIDSQSDALSQSESPEATGQAAQALGKSLQQLSKAMEKAGFGSSQMPKQGLFASDSEQAMQRGMRQLDSLNRRQSLGSEGQSENTRSLQADALRNLSQGIRGLYGHNQRSEQVIQELVNRLDEKVTPVDADSLADLIRQIQGLGRESAVNEPTAKEPRDLSGIDPTRFSPEYRSAIQKYYEKLSRQQ